MGLVTRIVCLANSRKRDGHCVAGLEIGVDGKFGRWIRPVGPRESESLTPDERHYADGTEPRLLDIIELTLLEHAPCGHQTENYRPHPGRHWKKIGRVPLQQLAASAEKFSGSLWFDGGSGAYGLNDMVPADKMAAFRHSLILLIPDRIRVEVTEEGPAKKRKVRANLLFGYKHYLLPITDPVAERKFEQMGLGKFACEPLPLCISLGKPYPGPGGPCYKLVASLVGLSERNP
jgi:putative nucleic acid modification protein with dual OB domain